MVEVENTGINDNEASGRIDVPTEKEKQTKDEKRKIKTKVVKDAISNGKTITGSPADQIIINPVQEAASNEKTAVMAFGRFNPPTTGHHKLIKKVEQVAKQHGGSAHIIASHSENETKNPLSKEKKTKYIKAISEPSTHVSHSSSEAPTLLHQAARLSNHAHHLVMVAGSDRVKEYHDLLHKYNNVEGRHGKYNFKSIKVISAGNRDPDAEGTTGISGTKMREHAMNGRVGEFKRGLPKELHPHAEEMIKSIQKVKPVESIVKKKKSIKEMAVNCVGGSVGGPPPGVRGLGVVTGDPNPTQDSDRPYGYIQQNISDSDNKNNIMKAFKQSFHDDLHAQGKTVAKEDLNYTFKKQIKESVNKRFRTDVSEYQQIADIYDMVFEKKLDLKDTHKRDQGTKSLVKIYKSMTPNQDDTSVSGDGMMEDNVPNREALPRSGQSRKSIDLMVRDNSDRKTNGSFYRQQTIQKQIVDEAKNDSHEYDYEGEMALNQLKQIEMHVGYLMKMIKPNTNLPEWVQSKMTLATDYIATCCDYLGAEMNEGHKRGLWDNIHAKQERIKHGSGEHMKRAGEKGRPSKADFVRSQKEDINYVFSETFLDETEAWQKKAGKNPEGGLNRKGIQSYRSAHPGSHLSLAVTKKPSELKAGSKSANRRKSFCARMGGMKSKLTGSKTARDPDSRINKALRKWHCHEGIIVAASKLAMEESQPQVRNVAGKVIKIHKELSRAVDGKMRPAYPGKSSSSGGED